MGTSSSGTAGEIFNWLYNLSASTGLIAWVVSRRLPSHWSGEVLMASFVFQVILGSYLRFYYGCKAQGIDRKAFPYVAPLQPYLTW